MYTLLICHATDQNVKLPNTVSESYSRYS